MKEPKVQVQITLGKQEVTAINEEAKVLLKKWNEEFKNKPFLIYILNCGNTLENMHKDILIYTLEPYYQEEIFDELKKKM